MRAQVFHGPDDLRYEEVPKPEPGAGEVLVRVEAALTCGTDVKTLRRGHPVMLPKLPTVFGHELAGSVEAVGPGVEGFRAGDRVVAANSAPCGSCGPCRRGRENLCDDLLFVNGAYAEYVALPERLVRKNLVVIEPAVSAARAAFAEPVACCLHALDGLEFREGDAVAVFGHGPLGLALGSLAQAAGARVVLVGKTGPRLAVAARLGFEACIDVLSEDDPIGRIRAVAGGQVCCVIDATGRPEVWEQAVLTVDKGGTVVFFGGCAPGTSVRLDTRRMHYEELTLRGVFHHTPALIRRAVALLASGGFDPMPLITHRMDLAGVPRALQLMGAGEALKVLIEPGTAPGS